MSFEQRLKDMGIELPPFGDGSAYYGVTYGKMKTHHITGNLLFLSGHTAGLDSAGAVRFPGRLGAGVTIEEGYAAARQTGLNCLAGIRHALGSLDRVKGLVRSLNFVACAPDFVKPHLVVNGLTDLMADVFGDAAGIGGRASIGVMSLADDYCFETWMTIEIEA